MKIGMVGLGAMGNGIAKNILAHGFPLAVYDIRPQAAAALVDQGAEAADSVQELGSMCDTVLIMVNTYGQCQDCLQQLSETKRGGTVIVCSTISMEQVQSLEKAASRFGAVLLDAPVSGGTAGAANGTLTIMAAGPRGAYEQCLPLFQAYGSTPVYISETVGHGQALKAVNQLLVGIHMCAAAEAFNMARQCGLDLSLMYDTIVHSAGCSRIFENRGRFFIDRDYSTRSTLAIQLKDTNIACQTAEQMGAPALLASLCRQLFAAAVHKFDPLEDSNAVIKLLEQWNASVLD